jgi:PIN domain nuclease of toxin-antitoxin system
MELLHLRLDHLEVITTMPFHHRDPFDRILIAQAMLEDIVIISADSIFSSYSVQRIWE